MSHFTLKQLRTRIRWFCKL